MQLSLSQNAVLCFLELSMGSFVLLLLLLLIVSIGQFTVSVHYAINRKNDLKLIMTPEKQ